MNPINNFAAHPHLSNLMTFAANLMIAIGAACLIMLIPSHSIAQQATLTDDAQISTTAPNQNFGANPSVRVSGTNIRAFFKFKLTPNLPPGTTGSRVGKATVRFFVGTVNTPGTFDVFRLNGTWDEATITGGTAPPLSILESSISVDALQTNKWVTLDVTQLVKDWLDGVLPNEGIALIANGGVGNVLFNSKENQTTSHETQLEIVLNHAATADRATEADNATNAATATSLSPTAVVPGSQISGDIPGKASSITGTVAGSQVTGPVAEAMQAVTANTVAASATVNGNQVIGDLINSTIAGSRVNGPVGNAINAITVNDGVYTIGDQTIKGIKTFSDAVNTSAQYNINGNRVLGVSQFNTFLGLGAGQANRATGNSFFGFEAGRDTDEGNNNSFFGVFAGRFNRGNHNSFFGVSAGGHTDIGFSNSFFGSSAGFMNQSGSHNSFFGYTAGQNNSNGEENSFFGSFAGLSNTSGKSNTFIGKEAGTKNTTGQFNVFVGHGAGTSNTTENLNTFIGADTRGNPGVRNATVIGALATVTQSNSMVLGNNVSVGIGTGAPQQKLEVVGNIKISGALNGLIFPDGTTLTTAPSAGGAVASDLNCANCVSESELSFDPATQAELDAHKLSTDHDGRYSLLGHIHNVTEVSNAATLGSNNFNGNQSINGDISATSVNAATHYNINGSRVLSVAGIENLFAGISAGQNNTGGLNAFFGSRAGQKNTSGALNSFFGGHAGQNNTTGTSNSFFGTDAGLNNTTGNANSFFGNNAGSSNISGAVNSFFGASAGRSNTTGSINSFFGTNAGQSNTEGTSNSFFGADAGRFNTTARNNTYMGQQAGQNNQTGEHNSFFGSVAGLRNTANDNSFFGSRAGVNNTSGNDNVFVGFNAGLNNTTGLGNAFLGSNVGLSNTTGIQNTFIGIAAGLSNTVENNNTFIGARTNGSPGITNATAIGSGAVVTQSNSIVLGNNVNVGIGTTAPQTKLHVQDGNILIGSAGQGIILKSPSGTTCRLLTIDDSGAMVLTAITCP